MGTSKKRDVFCGNINKLHIIAYQFIFQLPFNLSPQDLIIFSMVVTSCYYIQLKFFCYDKNNNFRSYFVKLFNKLRYIIKNWFSLCTW